MHLQALNKAGRKRIVAIAHATLVAWSFLNVRAIGAAVTGDILASSLDYRQVLQCGPNSLYMFLILCGRSDVMLEQCQNFPILSDGVSLKQLRDAARMFHVNAEILHYRPEEIGLISLPAIGLFNTATSTSITPLHFDVIYKIDAHHAYLLNGTTGLSYPVRRSKLPRYWTGYALTQRRSLPALLVSQGQIKLLVACLATLEVALFLLLRWFLRHRELGKMRTEVEFIS